MNKILLIEDQREFQIIVSKLLKDAQNDLLCAGTAQEAAGLLSEQKFDLILLDITLPDKNGLDFYSELQVDSEFKDVPVIFLTGDESPVRKVTAFALGAEDYITKPFHYQEFKARVSNRIKKSQSQRQSQSDFRAGPFQFRLGAQRLFSTESGQEIKLTPKEFRILYFLAQHDDVIMTRDQLLDEVWGNQTHVTDRNVDANIYLLRKKLGDHADCIEAVIGQGYRFNSNLKKKKAA